jgi:hypothetical protein
MRIFNPYVTIANERVRKVYLGSGVIAFVQKGIFIVSHLPLQRVLVFVVLSKGLAHLVTLLLKVMET